ncbi:MAG: hypothetical protein MR843_08775 [Bacteroidales bacterium]|nr:hypothetical protein [Bacteroidales bacterium]
MQANEAPQERMSAAWRQNKRECEPRRGSVMVETMMLPRPTVSDAHHLMLTYLQAALASELVWS